VFQRFQGNNKEVLLKEIFLGPKFFEAYFTAYFSDELISYVIIVIGNMGF
jgi:hypothetical protein